MSKRFTKKKLLYQIPAFLLCFVVLYIYKYNVVFIDADASSELVLANLLNRTNSLLTKDWYYSTEIKLINTNLIFTPLFSLFSNWSIIRSVGTGICLLLTMASAYYFYKQLGIKNKPLLISFLLLPISIQYFGMYIAQPYYEFSALKTYLTLGILIDVIRRNEKNTLKLILLFIISFIQGTDGLRNIILTILPIVICYAIVEITNYLGKLDDCYKKRLKIIRECIIILLISSLLGLVLLYFVLAKRYSFATFGDMSFILSKDLLSSLLNPWLLTFGYVEDKVLSIAILHNGLSFIIIGLSLYIVIHNIKNNKEIRKETMFLTVFYIVAVIILALLSLFVHFINSDMERYNLPVAIFAFPLIFDWFENEFSKDKLQKTIFACFVVLVVVCGFDNYYKFQNNENRSVLKGINSGRTNYDSVELNDIVYMLQEKGYKNGYSYF